MFSAGCRQSNQSKKDTDQNDSITSGSVQRTNGAVNNEGVELFYETVGIGKDTIIFLHGVPSTMYAFVSDLEIFSDYFTMIFFDQRGGGRSSLILNPDSLTWQANVKDLEAIRVHFNIDKLNIMGISWGSALAILYASEYPKHVNKLILLPMRTRKNPPIPEDAEPLPASIDRKTDSIINSLMNKMESAEDPIGLCEEMWSMILPYLFYDSSYINTFKGNFCQEPPEVIRYTFKVGSAKMGSLGDYDFRPILEQIHSPSLIIKGTYIRMYPEWVEEWAAWLPESRMLWVDETGLVPWVEKPELLIVACTDFISGNWPEGAKVIDKEDQIK
jgi:proline-specific peptidase